MFAFSSIEVYGDDNNNNANDNDNNNNNNNNNDSNIKVVSIIFLERILFNKNTTKVYCTQRKTIKAAYIKIRVHDTIT